MGNLDLKPNILVVEDDADLLEAISATLKLENYDVELARNGVEALKIMEEVKIGLVLTDVNMPEMDGITLLRKIKEINPVMPVLMMSAYGTVQKAVVAIKKGALDYLTKPFDCKDLIKKINYYLEMTTSISSFEDGDGKYSSPVVEDVASIQLLTLAKRVAGSNSSILITGESGTGKEVLAKYIHDQSDRRDQNFVAINCAAIPDNMLEAILFGHEKGAFTGAHQSTPGKFEQANGGTILLDEISEMDLSLQAKLLRVLQEREVERIGGKKVISLDVRVIATTNRKLQEYVGQGKFREDLFYRLNVFPLQWLPLRERKEDIKPLANHLLRKHAEAQQLGERYFDEQALERLYEHQWPGNVRELENVVQRSLILSSGSVITESDIFLEDFGMDSGESGSPQIREKFVISHDEVSHTEQKESVMTDESGTMSLGEDLQMREFKVILQTLKEVNGKRKSAAEKLGISPRTLRYKLARMRESGIVFESA